MKQIIFFVTIAFLGLLILFTYQYFKFHDGRLHIVFCDVGEGDGILITTPSNKHLLVDAGPDQKIIDCLGRHLSFWERTIDLAILTHPHSDHFTGYYFVIERYNVVGFATENLVNKTDGFKLLVDSLQKKKIKEQMVAGGDRWKLSDGVVLTIAGPTDEFIVRKNPDRIITNSAESGSLATKVAYGKFSLLLTGDAPVDEVTKIASNGLDINILQIPHHGSSTGVDGHVLDLLNPKLAVISVGKNNYGHPTSQTLGLLKERGLKVLRTDQMGDIEIISDGKVWTIVK